MSDLNTISDKLDQLLSIVKAAQPAPEHLAWMNPPITEAEAVIDEKTINKDGSVWTYDETSNGRTTEPQRIVVKLTYGYFSREKDPALHEALVKKFGEHYLRWYEKRDPWALYKADITDIVNGGSINWLNFAYFMQPYSRFVQ
jgi:hypothetical protein